VEPADSTRYDPRLMSQPKVLLVVDDDGLRAGYELALRFSGFQPVSISSSETFERPPRGVIAACLLTDHRTDVRAVYSTLLAWAIPVVRIDPFIRHAREHLPFDVVLPATSEPKRIISALRQLIPHGPHAA
jgi:hypothetical protein